MKRMLLKLCICAAIVIGGISAQTNCDIKASGGSTPAQKHTILHTNDIHGHMLPEADKGMGMAKAKTIKDQIKPDLLVDAGDAIQGLPLSNASEGAEMVKAMNRMGYDAMAVGNHEFDFGYKHLKQLEKNMDFPLLSANVYKDGKHAFKPSTIIKKNGVRYGVIGVTTPETKTKTNPQGIKGITFKDPETHVKAQMKRLNSKVDAYVVVSHLGVNQSTKTAWRGDHLAKVLSQDSKLKHPIMVVDGHSHTVLPNGKQYQNDVNAQTGTALANLGRIDFTETNHKLGAAHASLISAKSVQHTAQDQGLKQQIERANQAFMKKNAEVIIPNNKVNFEGDKNISRRQETNLGNAIVDAMESYGQNHFEHASDFAVTNGGGIRSSIGKGKVTKNDVISVLPFGNRISQIDVKGSDIRKAFETSLGSPVEKHSGKQYLAENGGFLQISHSIRVKYDLNKKSGERVQNIEVLNKRTKKFEKLNPKRTYHIATNDFTAAGGDGYDMFRGKTEEGLSLDKVFSDYLKQADLKNYDTEQPQRLTTVHRKSGDQAVKSAA